MFFSGVRPNWTVGMETTQIDLHAPPFASHAYVWHICISHNLNLSRYLTLRDWTLYSRLLFSILFKSNLIRLRIDSLASLSCLSKQKASCWARWPSLLRIIFINYCRNSKGGWYTTASTSCEKNLSWNDKDLFWDSSTSRFWLPPNHYNLKLHDSISKRLLGVLMLLTDKLRDLVMTESLENSICHINFKNWLFFVEKLIRPLMVFSPFIIMKPQN